MNTPITNIPQGLLSLMGLRDMGAVPRFVEPTITSGIDVTQFLLLNREELTATLNFNSVTSLSSAALRVPAGQLWHVHNITVNSNVLLAGETIQTQPGYIWGNVFFAVGDSMRATAGHRTSSTSYQGFWVPAGAQMAARTNEITTAGNIGVTVDVLLTRLRI
jgi:hypothetical protein